eukprot:TRINITY_DN3899_c0_g1_i2.p1 TRINITY_DN3899_c0_g1~~TRINITY_DN3899_c0_g1_i2.p1  ORF type:complete len:110 (-),score=7.18 TRINITY_DN3899_c0_g1_i2:224-553(-)
MEAGHLSTGEMALDSGQALLLACGGPVAPLFTTPQSNSGGAGLEMRRKPTVQRAPWQHQPLRHEPHTNQHQHAGGITSVDWHPLQPIFLTASTDNSVLVTHWGGERHGR